jgi:hypothetical protein
MSSLSKTPAPLWRARVSDVTDGPPDMGTSGEEKESTTKFGWIFGPSFYSTAVVKQLDLTVKLKGVT